MRDRAAAPDGVDRGVQRRRAGRSPAFSISWRGDRVGQQAGERLGELADGRAVRLHADRVDRRSSGPRPSVSSRSAAAMSSSLVRSSGLDAVARGIASRSGTRSMPITRPAPRCSAIRAAICPIGPSPKTATRAARPGSSAYSTRLPGRGQHVGEVEEALVRRALGHLDRPELGLRDAQVLRLAARHLAVQLGVAEQRRALALLAHLGRLALRVEAALAHPAVPAGDVERDHDAVAAA